MTRIATVGFTVPVRPPVVPVRPPVVPVRPPVLPITGSISLTLDKPYLAVGEVIHGSVEIRAHNPAAGALDRWGVEVRAYSPVLRPGLRLITPISHRFLGPHGAVTRRIVLGRQIAGGVYGTIELWAIG